MAPLPENPLAKHTAPMDPRDPDHPLKKRGLDMGYVVRPGSYALTDPAYADLLHRPTHLSRPASRKIFRLFSPTPELRFTTKNDPDDGRRCLRYSENDASWPGAKVVSTYGDDQPDEP